jgi:hypothetical protein
MTAKESASKSGLVLARNEWTLLIAYPDRAEPFVTQANGSRDDAIAAAH